VAEADFARFIDHWTVEFTRKPRTGHPATEGAVT
jgi:hypothetical protein